MFEALPSETIALRTMIADLHNDLEGRVSRLRLLMAIEYDFADGRGLSLPGGTPAHFAYLETRQAFVVGNFLSVILLSQCVLENVLAAEVALVTMSAEIQGRPPLRQKERSTFSDTIASCRKLGLLSDEDERDLLRVAKLRNAISHFRSMENPSHIDRRAISEGRSSAALVEDDARFAVVTFLRILAKPQFRFRPDTLSPSDNDVRPVE